MESLNVEKLLLENHAKFHYKCSIKFKVARLIPKRRMAATDGECDESAYKFRKRSTDEVVVLKNEEKCFVCGESNPLTKIESSAVDRNVRKWAATMNDFSMLAKMPTVGDLFAHDYAYHKHFRVL